MRFGVNSLFKILALYIQYAIDLAPLLVSEVLNARLHHAIFLQRPRNYFTGRNSPSPNEVVVQIFPLLGTRY